MRGLVTPSLHQGNSQDLLRKKWYTVPRFVYIDATVARVRATNYETMKTKALLLTLMAMIGLSVSAQPRIAVLDFNAGVQVSQNDVDGLSAIFNTYFEPAGYTVVERTRVSRIIEEQNMQGGRLTEKEMVKLSEILNVPVIVIGDVNKAMGQYNIDVRAVNVETGAILAKDGAEWAEGTSYRSMMRALAERLSKDIPLVEFVKPEPVIMVDTTSPKKKVLPKYRHEGWYIQPELGVPFGLAIGNQITSSFSLLGGFGIVPLDARKRVSPALPIYIGTRLSTPKYNFSLFAELRVGYDLQQQNSSFRKKNIIPMIQLGVMWRNLSAGIGTILYYDEYHGGNSYDAGYKTSISFSISYRIRTKQIEKWLF